MTETLDPVAASLNVATIDNNTKTRKAVCIISHAGDESDPDPGMPAFMHVIDSWAGLQQLIGALVTCGEAAFGPPAGGFLYDTETGEVQDVPPTEEQH